jgi:hypothetical protein
MNIELISDRDGVNVITDLVDDTESPGAVRDLELDEDDRELDEFSVKSLVTAKSDGSESMFPKGEIVDMT